MRTFLAVADKGSFADAARSLRLSPAAATRAVAMLEGDLGLPLFNRTTRSVRLTERGALYADRCRRILTDIEEVRSSIRGEGTTPFGLFSITAPVVFGRLHVLPLVETLVAQHAGLSARMVFVDRVTHLVEEGFDIAVRIGALADSALLAVQVAEVRRVLVASPNYLAQHGEPAHPADLRNHRIISFEGVGSTNDWRFGIDGRTSVTVSPALAINGADAGIASAIRGQGITRVLSYQISEAVERGELVRIMRDHEPGPLPVSLVYQANRRSSPNIRAFVDLARAYFAVPRWA